MNPTVEQQSNFDDYDLILATCGYESRSSELAKIATLKGNEKIAIGYGTNEEIAFQTNLEAFEGAGFVFDRVPENTYSDWLQRLLQSQKYQRILVDLSCLTRTRLADTVQQLAAAAPLTVDFYYSLAAFALPPAREPDNEFLGPVSEFFSGWAGEYGKPIAVISGLGYEHTKALGVIEYLDPTDTWLFSPRSPISDYDQAVERANDILIGDIDPSRVVFYDVMNATSLIQDLSGLIASIRTTHRCVILPLGPKVFAFCAMLVGCAFRDTSVWRASAGKFAKPSDKESSGLSSIFRVNFRVGDTNSYT